MSEPLLQIENLSKIFRRGGGELRAVDGISFNVNRGDIFGFLGPNGAGKSTTIRMALGLIHPTGGRVLIGGHDLATERLEALRKVGAFVEAPSFYGYLSGRTNLEIFAGLSGGASTDDILRIVELVGLKGREDDKVKVYSHGMKARLAIAACLLPHPELMVLDEPTDGLDPHGIREIRDLIKMLAREQGLTVFLSSHMLSEVENLCNRIAILEKGRVILHGELSALEKEHRALRIGVDRMTEAVRFLEQLGLNASLDEEGLISVNLNGHAPESINADLVKAGFAVRSIAPEGAWLDKLFLRLTTTRESNLRAGAAEERP